MYEDGEREERERERISTSALLRRPRHGVVVLFSGSAGSMQLSWSSGKPPLFYSTAMLEARQELNTRAPRIRNRMNLLNCPDSENSNMMMRTCFRETVRRVEGKAE